MSAIAIRDTDSWADMLPAVGDLAGKIATTSFVPKALRGKAPEVAACILTGREIGIGPMESLQKIHVIDGRPALSSELMRSLVLKAGHELRFPVLTDTKVTAEGRRAGSDSWTSVTWTMQEANRIGVTGKATWKQYPRQMLSARATAELCRLLFPDALGGITYLPDEIEDERPARAATTARRSPPAVQVERPEPELVVVEQAAPATRSRVPEPDFPEAETDELIVEAEIVEPADDSQVVDQPETTEVVADEPAIVDTLPTEDPDHAPPPNFEDEVEGEKPKLPHAITAPQVKMIGASMRTAGISDRTAALDFCASVIGRRIESRNELTKDEASRIIDVLAGMNQLTGDTP
jgi:hypothetical protein